MESTPHLVAHFMAAGAGQRLDDYHFLRNTYETISGQEIQLNRILRMLDEDEISLNWRIDTTPIGRARSRSVYDFDRTGDSIVLPGSIAYQRLREMEQEDLKRQPLPQFSSRIKERRKRLSQQYDTPPLSNSASNNPSAARLRALAEFDAELAESEAERRRQAKEKQRKEEENAKSGEIELISFTVRYEDSSSSNKKPDDGDSSTSNKKSDDGDSLGRLVCEWISPSSSSGMKHYTIERQLGDKEWLPIGDKIDNSNNQTELDILSLISDDNNNANVPSRFRLKAHLENGKTFTSQPTDEIDIINLIGGKRIIKPNVEILSANSVRLTWDNNENDDTIKYNIVKKEAGQTEWEKVTKVPLSKGSAQVDNLTDAYQCQFRLVPSTSDKDDEVEPEMLTVHNVNEWLSSLHLVPTSSNTVDVDISEEGFKEFDRYKVEYTTFDQLDQWEQMPDITHDVPHLTIGNLKQGADYKFRFTPILPGTTTTNEANPSNLSLVLDVKMPPSKKGRLVKDEVKTRHPPPQFAIHQTDPTSVLIEAIVPTDKPVVFDDVFDVYSKKETPDSEWTKIGTIDRDHLNLISKDLEENTAYAFKIHNRTSPSFDEQNNIIQEFQFETQSVKLYDPSLFLEKIEQSLENVVNSVMRAAAGHQTLDDPMNISLNEVIREIFHDEKLVPNEQYGFDTLALSNDLQLFRGPKQMMLQELDIKETSESSKAHGEIIIHNYRHAEHEHQPVIVREESGNTRIGNIDGDVIVRNVVTDVLLTNEETRNQLSMNIVGQAFLKGVQGTLIASKFKGIIVVKNVIKP